MSMNADAADFTRHLDAAFAALATPRATATFGAAAARAGEATQTPFRLAVDRATFAARKGAARGFWHEALHPRGRNIPDIRGRINRGQFRAKLKGEEVGREVVGREGEGPRAKGPAPPAQKARSPLPGVSPEHYDAARRHAEAAVQRAAAKGERRLRQVADRWEDKARKLIAGLKAQGHAPLKGTLTGPEAWLYAASVLKSRLAREAVAALPAGGAPRGETRQPPERGPVPPKSVRRLMRFTSAAVRRRVLHGLRSERQLAEALGALNLPDSEAADVVFLVGPGGEVITDHKAVLSALRVREDALRRAKGLTPEERTAAGLDAVLSSTLAFYEVKTLRTSKRDSVYMSGRARARKAGWEKRYAAPFFTVVVDDRRGKKFSGNRVYVARGARSFKLADMTPVASLGDVLGELGKEA
jgi:hypothetical protein